MLYYYRNVGQKCKVHSRYGKIQTMGQQEGGVRQIIKVLTLQHITVMKSFCTVAPEKSSATKIFVDEWMDGGRDKDI